MMHFPAILMIFTMVSASNPHSGSNSLSAGGGGSCTYDYATHDGSPVVTSARCKITSKDLNTGTEPGTSARKYVRELGGHDGCSNDDAGHILANRLGGKAVPTNLFPQSPHLNRGAWEQFERGVAACLSGGGASSATLSWTFSYASSSDQRPSTATYSSSYDSGCSSSFQSFKNTCTSLTQFGRSLGTKHADLNISCVPRRLSYDTETKDSGVCIVHEHKDGNFSKARDHMIYAVGTQLDIVHLVQPSENSTYSAITWCISSKSHVTASNNLIVIFGGSPDGAEIDCTSRKIDLDPHDCAVVGLSPGGANEEKIEICFNNIAALA